MLEERILNLLQHQKKTLAVAESCTGGGVLQTLTQIPGSSFSIWGGAVAYANDAKRAILNVSADLLERDGAISASVAWAMAQGIQALSCADWGMAITGIAGPSGGTPEQPVGTVWIAWINSDGKGSTEMFTFEGDRNIIKEKAIFAALNGLLKYLDNSNDVIQNGR